MKKIKIIALVMTLILTLGLVGCTSQEMAKSFGGETTINLPAGQKLEGITWKDADLWYLTRPMRADEEPETHTFAESSSFGIWEGTVTVVESR